jgi:hypothetical protein
MYYPYYKKCYSIEKERIFDTPELIIGQITALKLLLFSDRDAAYKVTKWGFQVGYNTTINKYW